MATKAAQVDLTNCDREPIHILGAIQPIGFLIALTSDWLIARASANFAAFLGRAPEELLGLPLGEVFSHKVVHDLRNRTAMLRGADAVERLFECEIVEGAEPFDIGIHISGGQVVIEAEPASGDPQALPDRMLAGHDVLLVEDSLIIALDAEDIAGRLGAETISTAATVDAALDVIDSHRPSVAMLDINLGDRTSFAVANRLLDLHVPFLFATGYGEQAQLPMEHRGRIVVQKPYTLENVARAMDDLIGAGGKASDPQSG